MNIWQQIKDFFKSFFNTTIIEPRQKLVIVMSGGAMNCAYGAGFLEGLATLKLPKKFTVIAAPGNAGNATYFASGQKAYMKNAWIELFSGNRLINFRRSPVLDIDYVIDIVFKKEFPLDIANMQNSGVEVVVPATCFETGELAYFDSKDTNLDWFEVLRAAKALPIVYGKKIQIGSLHYFDTPHSSSWATHLDKTEDLGATHTIIVNLNRLYNNKFVAAIGEYVVKNYFFADKEHYHPHDNPKKAGYEVETPNNVFIRPEELGDNLETKKEAIQALWQRGYDEAISNKNLKQMLATLK